jgi:carbon storage regulator
MLVLTRQIGQEIIIDGSIRVTVTSIKGDRVRIGITAPPEVRIDREEVPRRSSLARRRIGIRSYDSGARP